MNDLQDVLTRLGLPAVPTAIVASGQWEAGSGEPLTKRSPIDGSPLATFRLATPFDVEQAIAAAREAFQVWRGVPAPRRGEFVRRVGD